jgi:hypothetical protein
MTIGFSVVIVLDLMTGLNNKKAKRVVKSTRKVNNTKVSLDKITPSSLLYRKKA